MSETNRIDIGAESSKGKEKADDNVQYIETNKDDFGVQRAETNKVGIGKQSSKASKAVPKLPPWVDAELIKDWVREFVGIKATPSLPKVSLQQYFKTILVDIIPQKFRDKDFTPGSNNVNSWSHIIPASITYGRELDKECQRFCIALKGFLETNESAAEIEASVAEKDWETIRLMDFSMELDIQTVLYAFLLPAVRRMMVALGKQLFLPPLNTSHAAEVLRTLFPETCWIKNPELVFASKDVPGFKSPIRTDLYAILHRGTSRAFAMFEVKPWVAVRSNGFLTPKTRFAQLDMKIHSKAFEKHLHQCYRYIISHACSWIALFDGPSVVFCHTDLELDADHMEMFGAICEDEKNYALCIDVVPAPCYEGRTPHYFCSTWQRVRRCNPETSAGEVAEFRSNG